jgi:hypothetical protein
LAAVVVRHRVVPCDPIRCGDPIGAAGRILDGGLTPPREVVIGSHRESRAVIRPSNDRSRSSPAETRVALIHILV